MLVTSSSDLALRPFSRRTPSWSFRTAVNGSPRPRSGPRDPDGHRPDRRSKAESARPGRGGWRPNSVHVEYPAEMGAAHQEPGRSAARFLFARHFGRRFSGGSRGLARQRRAQRAAKRVNQSDLARNNFLCLGDTPDGPFEFRLEITVHQLEPLWNPPDLTGNSSRGARDLRAIGARDPRSNS